MDDKTLTELDELEKKATPGPWEQREDGDYYQGGLYLGREPYHYARNHDTGYTHEVRGRPTGAHANPLDCYFKTDVARVESQENADFIMALRNAWPAIRMALRAAREGHETGGPAERALPLASQGVPVGPLISDLATLPLGEQVAKLIAYLQELLAFAEASATHCGQLQGEVERVTNDLSMLATVCRTGAEPPNRDWTDEVYQKTANRAAKLVQEHEQLSSELRSVDAVLSRRPALDQPTRAQKIEHCISTAKRADEAQSRASALSEKLERCERDAARYRWLRDSHNQGANSPTGEGIVVVTERPSKEPRYIGPLAWQLLDATIDAAHAKQPKRR